MISIMEKKIPSYILIVAFVLLVCGVALSAILVKAQNQQWGSTIQVTSSLGESKRPSVAFDPSGNIHLAFESVTSHPQAYYAQFGPNGESIVPVKRISFTGDNVFGTDIATGQNNVFISWEQVDDIDSLHKSVYVAKLSNSGSVISTKKVTTDSNAVSPAIAVDRRTDDIYVVFHEHSYTPPHISVIYLTKLNRDINPIIPPRQLFGYYTPGWYPDIAVGNDGTVHATWSMGFVGNYVRLNQNGEVIGNQYWYGGVGTQRQDTEVLQPRIAVDRNDNAHIVFTTPFNDRYRGGTGGGNAVYLKVRNGQTVIQSMQIYTRGSPLDDYGAEDSAIDVDDQGNAHVLIQTRENTFLSRILYIFISASGVVSQPVDIGILPQFAKAEKPSITVGQGRVVAMWNDDRTGNMNLYMRIKS